MTDTAKQLIRSIQPPTSATDNAFVKFDGITGKKAKNSQTIEDSSGNVTIARNLTIGGNVLVNITTATNTYSILETDSTIIGNKSTAFTITLPSGVAGQTFKIKNIGAGTITLSRGGDTIDGETSQEVFQWDSMVVQYLDTNVWGIM